MPWLERDKYQENNKQKDKEETKELSEEPEKDAISLLRKTKKFSELEKYEPEEEKYYRNDAPIVKLPGKKIEKGALAPDIRGKLKEGPQIWIEVKDKSQRIYYPDTGCDIHQFIGFWRVNSVLNEPVLFMFRDPPIEEIETPSYLDREKEIDYFERIKDFYVNGNPAFYGNWLSKLAEFDKNTEYPHCWEHRSRSIPMKIIYFEIKKMVRLGTTEELIPILENANEHRSAPSFKVFDDEENKIITDVTEYKGDIL